MKKTATKKKTAPKSKLKRTPTKKATKKVAKKAVKRTAKARVPKLRRLMLDLAACGGKRDEYWDMTLQEAWEHAGYEDRDWLQYKVRDWPSAVWGAKTVNKAYNSGKSLPQVELGKPLPPELLKLWGGYEK